MKPNGTKKRALALAGGGPAAGLHIGALQAFEEAGIQFDVFALSCVGAWVGIVYNTRPERDAQGRGRAAQTYEFFERYCFRDDDSYAWFPMNRGFAPDFIAFWSALASFPFSRDNDWSKLVPSSTEAWASMFRWLAPWAEGRFPTQQEINAGILNDWLAVNPATRYFTSLAFKSQINGLARIYYQDSHVLEEAFQGDRLAHVEPDIYHNAWRMPRGEEPGRMQIFHNRPDPAKPGHGEYLKITKQSLCACSALPFIEESLKLEDGYEYTEGALVDTVNFANLLRDHSDLDEVWVSRIVDDSQVQPARSLADSLANLPMQFAAEVGEDDIKLFRQHLLNQSFMRPRVVEIPLKPRTQVCFHWSHANLKQGRDEGYEAVRRLLAFDPQLASNVAAPQRATASASVATLAAAATTRAKARAKATAAKAQPASAGPKPITTRPSPVPAARAQPSPAPRGRSRTTRPRAAPR
ncbi:MAG TPA: patatin-like phospholipase family protein [Ramlibacter sp.]|uniref:patatin-like phospholipase family protein n=1 Tax=Ramlibacter sp. TaxID=1917967 RepID=UPI002D808BE8|nr:patatin-like phospholipase family protein [Ramlibacter sp.]HET8748549.1 patatin-like phospholipase family protein [Ramlibacter sp.]